MFEEIALSFVTLSLWKTSVFKVFAVHANTESFVFIFFQLKERFLKLRFRDGLVWTVGLSIEIKY